MEIKVLRQEDIIYTTITLLEENREKLVSIYIETYTNTIKALPLIIQKS